MDRAILAREALKLPAWERAQIIDVLWRSLDPDEQGAIDQAWVGESCERLEAYRVGKLEAKDGEESLRGLEDELRR
jgi:putative addiction module component (TIGR02574 family)